MRIQCLTTFLDGPDRFERGDLRTVADERGAFFVAQGWAAPEGRVTAAASTEHGNVVLDIQDATMSQEVKHG